MCIVVDLQMLDKEKEHRKGCVCAITSNYRIGHFYKLFIQSTSWVQKLTIKVARRFFARMRWRKTAEKTAKETYLALLKLPVLAQLQPWTDDILNSHLIKSGKLQSHAVR